MVMAWTVRAGNGARWVDFNIHNWDRKCRSLSESLSQIDISPDASNGEVGVMSELIEEPPREVWVMSSRTGADFVSTHRQDAMDRASDWSADFPENGPYRVCRYVAEPFAGDAERIADLERELTEQAKCNGMGSEREAALMAERDHWHREAKRISVAYDMAERALAAAQATIQRKDEAIKWSLEFFQRAQWREHRANNIVADTLAGSVEPVLSEALAIPADRTALDAMLAEARKEGMLKAAGICEGVTRTPETNGLELTIAADAIRQAAERSGECPAPRL